MEKGLAYFLSKVYLYSGVGFISTILISILLNKNDVNLMDNSGLYLLLGFLGTIITLLYISFTVPTLRYSLGCLYAQQSIPRLLAFILFILSNSLIASPIIGIIYQYNSNILIYALLLTVCTVISCVVYTINVTNEIKFWGPGLFSILSNVTTMSLLMLISKILFPSSNFPDLWFNIESYIGIVIFALYIIYDTHIAIKKYECGNPDYIIVSIEIYLDILNLFIRLLKIFLKLTRSRSDIKKNI